MPELIKFVSRADLSEAKVDRGKGIIYGVSLCSIGDAKGHNKYCDRTTLEQLRDCAQSYDKGLKIKFNPERFDHGPAGLIGYIPNESMRIKNGKLIGDFQTYESYPQEAKDYLFELAEKNPDHFGLSVEFSGEDEEKDGQNFARCAEIYSAAFVDLPAANPTGLFAAEEKKSKPPSENNKESASMTKEELNELSKSIVDGVSGAVTIALTTALAPVTNFFAKKAKDDEEPTAEELAAAGVSDDDADDVKKKKMAAYREEMSQPIKTAADVTQAVRRGFMQVFRETGGRRVVSSAGEGARQRKKDDPFEELIDAAIESGAKSRGRAILMARQRDPKAYNGWMAKRNGQDLSTTKRD